MENLLLWITKICLVPSLFSFIKNYDRIVAIHGICAYGEVG